MNDVADALTQLDWYACRWVIEEYHKCLKSGCAIEKRQLETGKGLVTLQRLSNRSSVESKISTCATSAQTSVLHTTAAARITAF